MKNTNKLFLLILAFILVLSALLLACGKRKEGAPDGSTITFNPASHSQSGIAAPTCATFDVTVRYSDGTPMPNAIVTIYGPFAEPRNTANANARYQFFAYGNCDLNPGGNIPVDSGFQVQTNDSGIYTFSANIFDIVTQTTPTGTLTAPNVFSDTIEAHSGQAFGSAAIEVQ